MIADLETCIHPFMHSAYSQLHALGYVFAHLHLNLHRCGDMVSEWYVILEGSVWTNDRQIMPEDRSVSCVNALI